MLSEMTPLLVQTDLEKLPKWLPPNTSIRSEFTGAAHSAPRLPSWTWQPLLGTEGREDQEEKGGKRKKMELGYGRGGKEIGPKKVELGSPSVKCDCVPGVAGWLCDCTSNCSNYVYDERSTETEHILKKL